MSVLPAQGLDRSLILKKGHHDLTVSEVLLLVDDDVVSGQNARVQHGLTADPQGEMLSGQAAGVKGEIVLDALFGQNGRPGGHIPHHW